MKQDDFIPHWPVTKARYSVGFRLFQDFWNDEKASVCVLLVVTRIRFGNESGH